MMTTEPLTSLELRTTISADGELTLDLVEVAVPEPAPDEVVVRVEATPINPSDLGLLIGPADLSTMAAHGTADRPVLKMRVPEEAMPAMAPRLGQSMPVGNEGAGTVVRAGAGVAHLLGKKLGMIGGAMYTQYRVLPARTCMELPDGATAADGASMFVNPLTALAMVETMRREGHTALVHTAAASNLGQMLNRICIADGVKLVNIVRSEQQAEILRALGAAYIVNSTAPDFAASLTDALEATGATIAFDAIGGGDLPNTILHAMEAAANRKATAYSRYGSNTFKQVYIYGWLGQGPTVIDRSFGFAWSVGGFLLTPFLAKIGHEAAAALRARVARELTTTFASHYTQVISLRDALRPDVVAAYMRKATGEKYLIDPSQ
jgi:NADPH:quinone reductase-like Zn-dependent oxidoreductase